MLLIFRRLIAKIVRFAQHGLHKMDRRPACVFIIRTHVNHTTAGCLQGTLSERFGYINDDPPARFLLRALTQKPSEGGPPGGGSPADPGFDPGAPQGKWWRFDSGRAQLLRPVLELAGCPAGTVIEVCYCQALIDGKCSPYHPLCGGAVCYMDRYTVGPDLATKAFTICPLEPRGCRYVEVHVLRDDDPPGLAAVSLTKATALYRSYDSYHVPPSGHFQATETASEAGGGWWGGSGQGGQGSETRQLPVTLEKIWAVGADTTRSCCEDSCIDGPCRERGMWLGDTAAVSLPNLVYMYDDIAIIRLMLQQTAYKASSTGVFSGNCPSGGAISDYALLWMEALAVYLQATGDRPAVAALWPACTKCVDYFLSPKCYTDAKGCESATDFMRAVLPVRCAERLYLTVGCDRSHAADRDRRHRLGAP